ncbi:MAG: toll/interleukin-1 receptor domain-containing protein [Cyclobacteriaceae bacterium]
MPLYTEGYFRNLYERNRRTFSESYEPKVQMRESATFDIFLSHNYLDKEVVRGIFIELSRKGFKVYVDWIIDHHLSRESVTKESAELIRTRMRNSKSLILALSENYELSKWMPWELGYVDGNTQKCALLPVTRTRNKTSFHRVEYLKLYPYIKTDDISSLIGYGSSSNNRQLIMESGTSYTDLKRWVNGDNLRFQLKNIQNL